MSGLEGFSPRAFEWFEGLLEDNSRAYFSATRAVFEAEVRDAFTAMLGELREEFGGEPKVFRQHRDLRFSPDKSPYKTRTYGVLLGAPGGGAGLYAEVSASGLYAGTGYYQLARDQLERYRAAVSDEGPGAGLADALAAVRGAGLEIEGRSLRGDLARAAPLNAWLDANVGPGTG